DLEALTEEILHGVPEEAAPLARLSIEGLSRGWILQLHDALAAAGVFADLPFLERVRLWAYAEPERFAAALPTHGLAERLKAELNEQARAPLALELVRDPLLAARFYD